MNKLILNIFLVLSIFSSVQSFAHPNELTESEHIAQLLEGLIGYANTLGHSYEPVKSYDFADINDLSIIEVLDRIDSLKKKASNAEQLQQSFPRRLLF